MTANQSNSIIENPNTKKAIAVLKRYAKAEAALKALEAESKEATEQLKQAMIDANVPKLVFDPELSGIEGYITLAERVNYKADEDTDFSDLLTEVINAIHSNPETDNTIELVNKLKFVKLALDIEKVKAQATLTGQLPVGVVESKTTYVTKKIKLAE